MDHQIAQDCLAQEMGLLKRSSYAELSRLIGRPRSKFVAGSDDKQYQIETQVFWDDETKGNIRVLLAADCEGLSAVLPLTDSFIMSPEGILL